MTAPAEGTAEWWTAWLRRDSDEDRPDYRGLIDCANALEADRARLVVALERIAAYRGNRPMPAKLAAIAVTALACGILRS